MRILFSFCLPKRIGVSSNISDTLTTFGKRVADRDLKVLQILIGPKKTLDEIVEVLYQALEKNKGLRIFQSDENVYNCA